MTSYHARLLCLLNKALAEVEGKGKSLIDAQDENARLRHALEREGRECDDLVVRLAQEEKACDTLVARLAERVSK